MQLEMVFSCVAYCYLASVSNALGISANNRVLGPQRIQRFTGNALRISFQSDWQINNGFFNRPNPGTQRGPEQRFRRCFANGLNQSLVSSVAQVIKKGDDHELNDTGARKWRKIQK